MKTLTGRLRACIRRLRRDIRGGVLIYTAFATPALVGFTGLAVDAGIWYADKREVQTIADAASVAGALEILRSGGVSTVTAATFDATTNGYDAAGGDTIEVNSPPTSGSQAGNADAVEVIVRRTGDSYFASVLDQGSTVIAARAVAVSGIKDSCIYSLDPSAKGAIKVVGGANLTLNCGIRVNSTDPEALEQTGGACITATKIKIVGGFSGDCVNPDPTTGVGDVADPFELLEAPENSGCDYNGHIVLNSGTTTLSPGVYCGSITVNAGATVEFESGTYVLDRAGLTVASGSTATGSHVSFYLTENATPATNVSFQGTVDLSAPIEGEQAGILIYQSASAPDNINHIFTGGADMKLDGVLYFPNLNVNFAGGSGVDASSSMIVAKTLSLSGQSEFQDLSGSTVSKSKYLAAATIVE